ncbi:DUF397 domain-containing protein [Micromonospora sp. PTRAS2]
MSVLDLGAATWRTSTRSGANGNCVEVAQLTSAVALRDSKDRSGPALVFTAREWAAFIEGTKDGEFDQDRPTRRRRGSGAKRSPLMQSLT